MGQTSRKAHFNDSSPLGRFFGSRREPPAALVGVIVLGTLATSAAGCVINDLWDRDIDPEVERTRSRPLASRALTVQTGIGVALISFAMRGDSRFLSQSFKLLAVCRRRTGDYLLSPSKKILSRAAISVINCLGFCSFN